MILVSPGIALLFFAVILVVAGAIAWYMKDYSHYDKGAFHTFIAVLAGLGVFVTFMFYYNVVQLQNQQQQLAALEELARINDSVLNSVLTEIKTASLLIPNFVGTITPLNRNNCCGSTGCVNDPDPINSQTCAEKLVLSYRIFNLWQDTIEADQKIKFDPIAYITNFLQFANSPQLFDQWVLYRLNFNSNTITVGNLLFEYGLPITNQTAETYRETATKVIKDTRFKNVFI